MKKYLIIFAAATALVSCKTQYDEALKSADKNFILEVANDKFEHKKWKEALALYERLTNLVAGTDEAATVIYNSAYANYYDKNYRLAGHQFKNFAVTFPKDPRREEAAYMSALCYYQGSLDYNLDQTNTISAINELQDFLDNYPDSERSKNINQLIDELNGKIEVKAYENARQYYKMGEYTAAIVTLNNVLDDFPSISKKPEIYGFLLRSHYELAMNSVPSLKQERIQTAIAFTKTLEKEYPNTPDAALASNYREKLSDESVKFAALLKESEKRQAELTERQKRIEAQNNRSKKTQETLDYQQAEVRKTEQALRDSAISTTPPPAATFKIQR